MTAKKIIINNKLLAKKEISESQCPCRAQRYHDKSIQRDPYCDSYLKQWYKTYLIQILDARFL